MMAAGLLLSAVVNILIGLSPEMNGIFNFLDAEGKATAGLVVFIGSLWLINGYTQGMGYPPCGSLMAHWIRPSELATKQSIWNSSHSIGAKPRGPALRNGHPPAFLIRSMAMVLLHPGSIGNRRRGNAFLRTERHTGVSRPSGS